MNRQERRRAAKRLNRKQETIATEEKIREVAKRVFESEMGTVQERSERLSRVKYNEDMGLSTTMVFAACVNSFYDAHGKVNWDKFWEKFRDNYNEIINGDTAGQVKKAEEITGTEIEIGFDG